ncbi:MAG: AAA family ATPase [Candidatus Tritonobacter lacicola]|nr:AAA family ATPase [Candidatus Tritonobacter lacicola]
MTEKKSFRIAVTGKGGVGKTTITGLILKYLIRKGLKPVLVIDADPSINLPDLVGVNFDDSIGGIRENGFDGKDLSVSKSDFFQYKAECAISECDDFDLLVMGRPEGPGCYCFVNNILRNVLDTISRNYRFVLMDCEAGLEHLSRRTTRDIDLLVLVVDGSRKSFLTAKTIVDLAGSLKTRIGRVCLVLNGSRGTDGKVTESWLNDLREFSDFEITVPNDPEVASFETEKKSILRIPDDSTAYKAMSEGMDKILPLKNNENSGIYRVPAKPEHA